MKKTIVCLLLICSFAFASRNEDLKVILEKTYLTAHCEPLLSMVAMEAITESQKKIESEQLIELFRKNFSDSKNLASFFEPYKMTFSDEEIAELRKIHENPVWQKYASEGLPIFQSNMETLKQSFKELATNYVVEEVEETECVVSADILQVSQDNVQEIEESSLPVILDVNATWCNPCKMMNPIIDELSEKYQGKIQFAKMDYDSQQELAQQYGVTSLPTLLFFKPGQKTPSMKSVGYMGKKDFEAKIQEFLKK